MPSSLTSMPFTLIKPNGRNHTTSFLKGLIHQTQSALLPMAKSAIRIHLALGLEEREFVLGRFLQKAQ